MDFSIRPELQAKLAAMREFINAELIPIEHSLSQKTWEEVAAEAAPLREKVKAKRWWAPNLPPEIGGTEASVLELGLISEQCGRTPLGHYVFGCQAPDAGNAELLFKHGSDEIKQQYLLPMARGEIRSCFSMTEPEFAGSNPVRLGTTAVLEGDEYVIDGRKWFTSSYDGSAFIILMAVTEPDAAPHARASMILVPSDAPGVEFVRNVSVMGHAGGGYASHAELRYTNVRVPASNLLGPPGGGFMLAQERLGPGRIHHCMRWLGICDRAFEMMLERAGTREVAEGKLLGSKQLVQAMIAESRAEIDAARLLVLHAAWSIDNEGFKDARAKVSAIKFHAANVLQNVVDRAIQLHGALGMTDDTVLSYWYREERAARIYDGPDEVHKVSLARQLLKPWFDKG